MNQIDNKQRRKIFEEGNVQIAPLISKTNTIDTSKSYFGPEFIPVKSHTRTIRSKSHHRLGRGWLASRPSSSYRSTSSRTTTTTTTTADPSLEESSEIKEDSPQDDELENKLEVEDREEAEKSVTSKGTKKPATTSMNLDDESAANPDYDNYEDEDYGKQEKADSEEKPLIKTPETTTTTTITSTTTSTNKPPSVKLSTKEGAKLKGVNEKKGRKEDKLSSSSSKLVSQQTTSKKRTNETTR